MFHGEQINIFPKVFRKNKAANDISQWSQQHFMNNLTQWLAYCNKIDHPFINILSDLEDSDNLKEFFITLFIGYVKMLWKEIFIINM